MSARKSLAFVLLTSYFLLLSSPASAQSFPKPLGRVSDFAGVIDAETEAALDRQIEQLELKTSSEIAVATVTSLEGMSIEEYANRLFKQWGVGQARQDNGVLILVAPGDRAMRIEVGYGLEGVLPDGLTGQIGREHFAPRFRDNDYSGGIRDGVARVIEIVERHEVLTPEQLAALNAGNAGGDAPAWIVIPFFSIFITIGFGMLGIGLRTKTGFPVLFGGFFGGMPLVMSLAFVGTLALMTLLPWAVAMFVLGYRLGARQSWRDAFRDAGKGKGGGSSSGWTMGASRSSGSSGSSSSSGSFGGGSSGGGGSTTRW